MRRRRVWLRRLQPLLASRVQPPQHQRHSPCHRRFRRRHSLLGCRVVVLWCTLRLYRRWQVVGTAVALLSTPTGTVTMTVMDLR